VVSAAARSALSVGAPESSLESATWLWRREARPRDRWRDPETAPEGGREMEDALHLRQVDGGVEREVGSRHWRTPDGGAAARRCSRYERRPREFDAASDLGVVLGTISGRRIPRAGGAPQRVEDKFLAVLRCDAGTWRVAHLAWSPREGGD
jgi:hypothetical protein